MPVVLLVLVRQHTPGAHLRQGQTRGVVTWQSLGRDPFAALRQASRQAEPEARGRGSTCVLAEIADLHVALVVVLRALRVLLYHWQVGQLLAVDGFD